MRDEILAEDTTQEGIQARSKFPMREPVLKERNSMNRDIELMEMVQEYAMMNGIKGASNVQGELR